MATHSLVFFGSDEYSALVLSRLLTTSHKLLGVITAQGSSNSVEKLARTHNVKVFYYPVKINELSKLVKHGVIGISASFGRILPAELIRLFDKNIVNLHPSLLPQYRNVAPVPYALAMGDTVTGITIFHMDEHIDHGEILAQTEEKILATDTTPTLLTRLFTLGSDLLIKWITEPSLVPAHHSEARKSEGWIFTHKLSRESGLIEWTVFQKYLLGRTLKVSDTTNPLLALRLNNHPERNSAVSAVFDLSRALTGYEKLWTRTPQGKELQIISLDPLLVQIPGKPRPIPYSDFDRYYLTNNLPNKS